MIRSFKTGAFFYDLSCTSLFDRARSNIERTQYMKLKIVAQHPDPSRVRLPSTFKRDAITSALKSLSSILICRKAPSQMEGDVRFVEVS